MYTIIAIWQVQSNRYFLSISLIYNSVTWFLIWKIMKTVVIGESSGASMETIMSVYPRHKAVVDKFISQGAVIGIGPFSDRGNMAIFRTRTAAEEFVKEDPFILEGLVKSFTIREWNDNLIPE
jgi:uncharacterized protein YciI